jgi:hypothetical protein
VSVLTPFTGRDGDLVAAWADNASGLFGDDLELPEGAGRLHVTSAPPGAAPPPSAPPAVTVPRPRAIEKLWSDQPAELTASCDGPCDLRAFVPGPRGPLYAGSGTLAAAGTTKLRLYGGIARRKARVVTVGVHACSPDGTAMSSVATRLRVVRRKPPPLPAPVGVRATPTAGGNVIVTWHTRVPAQRAAFLVAGRPRRHQSPGYGPAYAVVEGRGHTQFSTTVRPAPGSKIRWVSVQAYSTERDRPLRAVLVPVSR